MAQRAPDGHRNNKARGGPRSGDPGSDRAAVLMSVSIAGVLGSMAKGVSEQAASGQSNGPLTVVEAEARAARDAASCYWYLVAASGVDRAAHLCESGLRHAGTAEHKLKHLPTPALPVMGAAQIADEQWIALHAELDAPYLAKAVARAHDLLEAAYPHPARREAAALALHAARDLLTCALTLNAQHGAGAKELADGHSHLENLRDLLHALGAVPAADSTNPGPPAPTGQAGTAR
jgi:hypothetical protein